MTWTTPRTRAGSRSQLGGTAGPRATSRGAAARGRFVATGVTCAHPMCTTATTGRRRWESRPRASTRPTATFTSTTPTRPRISSPRWSDLTWSDSVTSRLCRRSTKTCSFCTLCWSCRRRRQRRHRHRRHRHRHLRTRRRRLSPCRITRRRRKPRRHRRPCRRRRRRRRGCTKGMAICGTTPAARGPPRCLTSASPSSASPSSPSCSTPSSRCTAGVSRVKNTRVSPARAPRRLIDTTESTVLEVDVRGCHAVTTDTATDAATDATTDQASGHWATR